MTATNHPIFVVGAPRSGTTLLQYMLKSHPNISIPSGESHFVVPMCQQADNIGDVSTVENRRRALTEMYQLNATFLDKDLHGMTFDIERCSEELTFPENSRTPDLIDALLSQNAAGEGKQRWGDKTPYYSLHIPMLSRNFPTAQFIHIVRDGRDCAVSMLGRAVDLQIFNIYEAAYIWNRYVTAADNCAATLGPQRYLSIRYESLTASPESVVKEICEFLGEAFDESVIDFKKPSNPSKTPLLGQPVKKENSGKWRDALNTRQVAAFERLAGDTLIAHGYELEANSGSFGGLWELGYRLHGKAARWYHN